MAYGVVKNVMKVNISLWMTNPQSPECRYEIKEQQNLVCERRNLKVNMAKSSLMKRSKYEGPVNTEIVLKCEAFLQRGVSVYGCRYCCHWFPEA